MQNIHLLNTIYDQITDGLPLLGTPAEAAHSFSGDGKTLQEQSERLIAFYVTLGSATGFVFGLPGYLFLPVTLPANIAGAVALQLHLCAAIAALAGRDPQDEAVKRQCIDALLHAGGDSQSEEGELATRTSVKLGERGIRYLIERGVSARLARQAASKIGFRSIPILGGMLGAASDGYFTRQVGEKARSVFLEGTTPEAQTVDNMNGAAASTL